MRKFLLLLLVLSIVTLRFAIPQVFSDELDDINKKLSELQTALSASQKATAPLESQLNSLHSQLIAIENRVKAIEYDIAQKKKFIDRGYRELDENKTIFNKTVRDYYIKSYFFSPLLVFISSADAADVTRMIIYQKKDADRDKETITALALKLVDLETRKQKLEEEEEKFAIVKEKLAQEKGEIEKVVKGAKQNYQERLQNCLQDKMRS